MKKVEQEHKKCLFPTRAVVFTSGGGLLLNQPIRFITARPKFCPESSALTTKKKKKRKDPRKVAAGKEKGRVPSIKHHISAKAHHCLTGDPATANSRVLSKAKSGEKRRRNYFATHGLQKYCKCTRQHDNRN